MTKHSPSITAQAIAEAYLKHENDQDSELGKAFGSEDNFYATLDELMKDAIARGEVSNDNGVICGNGQTDSAEFIEKFNDILVKQWPDSRPSLPVVAMTRLEDMGIDIGQDLSNQNLTAQEQSLAKAIMFVAARAEMVKGQVPDADAKDDANRYHCTDHTGHVAEVAGYLAEKNNALYEEGEAPIELTRAERMMTVLAALGHDVDHMGTPNPDEDAYKNEDASFAIMEPIMRAAGVSQADMDDIHVILRTTSPNGPHNFLKDVLKAHEASETVTLETLDTTVDQFAPELGVLIENRRLATMAAIISDSDLFPSAGAGMEANVEMSDRLSDETNMNFRTPEARQGFVDFVVGGQFASHAGRAVAGDTLDEMYKETEAEIQRNKEGPLHGPFGFNT